MNEYLFESEWSAPPLNSQSYKVCIVALLTRWLLNIPILVAIITLCDCSGLVAE